MDLSSHDINPGSFIAKLVRSKRRCEQEACSLDLLATIVLNKACPNLPHVVFSAQS